ncbi:MAG: fatty acid desaturase, partial [Steroidobacteraceae bacterium]|nr:fatty acid desaturase [Steroidobacteraceae bacterium]
MTREWVAVHRKHHAACETPKDPHSPQTRGIAAVLLRGSELCAAAAKDRHMLAQYGAGTPDDWLERKLYTPCRFHGVGLMLAIDLLAFGAIGASVWAVQMRWIPLSATGIVNGIGHWSGYRIFELVDASRNIVPWGILIGGEELHNNHHTCPTSAKLSVRRHAFDLGWTYIRGLEMLGLATVRRVPPQLRLGSARPVADASMLDAIIANRYEFMANYARRVRRAALAEGLRLRAEGTRPPSLRTCAARAAGYTATRAISRPASARRRRARLRKTRRFPNWSRCTNNCGSCGRARAQPANNLWPTCRLGQRRPKQTIARRSTSSRRCCARFAREMPRTPESKAGTDVEGRTAR